MGILASWILSASALLALTCISFVPGFMEKAKRSRAIEKVKRPDWSMLHSDLLVSVTEHLHLKDIAQLPAVCGGWALALGRVRRGCSNPPSTLRATLLPLKNSSPWLLLPNEDVGEAEYCDFLKPSENDSSFSQIRIFPLPEMVGRMCVGGSLDGRIATVDIWLNCQILNPLTGEVFLLPPLSTIFPYTSLTPIYSDEGDGSVSLITYDRPTLHDISFEKFKYKYVYKIALSSSPLCIAFLIHDEKYLAMARVGDMAWTPALEYPKYIFEIICDVVYNEKENKFFAINLHGNVFVFDLKNYNWGSFLPPEVTNLGKVIGHELIIGPKYVVFSSSGDLLQVWRQCEKISDNFDDDYFSLRKETNYFKIFKLDPGHYDSKNLPSCWIQVNDIGDDAMFLGLNHSTCITTYNSSWLRKNSVYFTQSRFESRNYSISNYASDVGIFDLKDHKIERFFPRYSKVNWPFPVWFMPSSLQFFYDS